MNEKSCETCRCACKGRNLIGFTCWQPKEEKMIKPIFESEDEFDNFADCCVSEGWKKIVKERAMHHGYIRPDPVQEVEEMYHKWHNIFGTDVHINDLCEKQHEVIQLMKPYYEKHKGEKL